MSTLLWVIAVLDLIGGILLAVEMESFVWVVAGIVTFAIIGGFATVISTLNDILSKMPRLKHLESAQIEMNEKLQLVNNKLTALDGSVNRMYDDVRRIAGSVTQNRSDAPTAASISVGDSTTEAQTDESVDEQPVTLDEVSGTNKAPIGASIREQVIKDLSYAAGLASPNRVRSIVKNLYSNTKYEPLKEIISLPDDEIKSAINNLLASL